ncbi:MAG: TIGR02996 domain-containing protein [Kofleriaceae bacterium]
MSDALMDAIVADPDDDAPRLVWADREGGERGELVVLQCQLARRDLPRVDRRRLRARERELLQREADGLDRLGRGTFVRGFVERVGLDVWMLAERSEELFARAPLVRALVLANPCLEAGRYADSAPDVWREHAEVLATAFAALPPGKIHALSAWAVVHLAGEYAEYGNGDGYGDELAGLIAEAPALAELADLTIYRGQLTHAAIPHLARLRRLERLCADPELGGEGCVELLRAVPSLTRLAWGGFPRLSGIELSVLLAAPEIARLCELDLRDNQLTPRDLLAIARAPLASLERLGLSLAHDSAPGFAAILAAPQLAGLAGLALDGSPHADLGALLESTFAAGLRELDAPGVALDEAAVRRLGRLPALERVHLALNPHSRSQLAAVIPDVDA